MRIKTTQYSNVLILAFLAIAAIAGVVLIERTPAEKTSDIEKQNIQQVEVTWHKYDKEGISFEYPSNMQVLETPLYGALVTVMFNTADLDIPEEMKPRIQIYKVDETLDTVVRALNTSRNKDQFPELSAVEIGNKKAYQTKALDPEIIFTHTVLGDENTTYLFEMFSSEVKNDELQNAYQRVVETFNL